MMVMSIIALADEFKPCGAVAEIKPLHHPHFLEQVHGAINRGQITTAPGQDGKDFPIGHRMWMPPQNLQNGLAWAGNPS